MNGKLAPQGMQRVGGGFRPRPNSPGRGSPSSPGAAAVSRATLRAIPEPLEPYSTEDLDLLAEILRSAEDRALRDAKRGRRAVAVTQLRVLQAYEAVLRAVGIDAQEDEYFYRPVLQMCLDPEPDWWRKFDALCRDNADKAAWLERARALGASPAPSAAIETQTQTPPVQDIPPPLPQRDALTETQAYALFKLLSMAFHGWAQQASSASAVAAARRRAVENWMVAVSFWECRASTNALRRWRRRGDAMRGVAEAFGAGRSRRTRFRQWRSAARSSCDGRKRGQARAIAMWRGNALGAALRRWREGADDDRAFALRCMASCADTRTRMCMRGWASVAHKLALTEACGREAEYLAERGMKTRTYMRWRAAYNERVRRRAQMGRAVAACRLRTLVAALNTWRHRATTLIHYRESVRLSLANIRLNRERAALARWVEFAHERAAVKTKTAMAVAKMQFSLAARATARWTAYVQETIKQRVRLERCTRILQGGIGRRAMNQWKGIALEHARLRRIAGYALKRTQQRQVSAAFERWCVRTAEIADEREAAGKAARYWLNRTVGSAFDSWYEKTQDLKAQRQQLRKAVAWFTTRASAVAFQTWMIRVEEASAQRDALTLAVRWWISRSVGAAFECWVEKTTSMAHARELANRSLLRLLNATKAAAFASWSANAKSFRHERELLHKAAALWRNVELRKGFAGWVATMAEAKDKMARALVYFRGRAQQLAFLQWQENASRLAYQREALEGAIRRLNMRAQAAVMARWIDYVVEVEEMRMLGERAARYFRNSTLGAAWRRWLAYVEELEEARALVQLAAAFRINRALLGAWSRWMDFAVESVDMRSKLRVAVQRFAHAKLATALLSWREWVPANKEKMRKVSMAAAFTTKRSMVASFATWKRVYEVHKRAVNFFVHSAMFRSFLQWREGALYQKETFHKLQQAAARMMKRQLSAAFTTLKQHVDDMRKARQAMIWFANLALAKAFKRWCDYAVEVQVARDQAEKAMRLWMNTSTRQAFARWEEFAAESAELRAKMLYLVKRFSMRAAATALSRWLDFAVESAAMRDAVRQAVAHWVKKELVVAFERWCNFVVAQQEDAEKMGKALRGLRNRQLTVAWERWTDAVEEIFDMRAKLEKALRRFANAAVYAAYNAWATLVETRIRQRAAVRKSLGRVMNREKAAAMVQWLFFLERRRARYAAEDHYRAHLAKAMLRSFAHSANIANLARKGMRRLLNRQLSGAWAVWTGYMQYLHEQKEQALSMQGRAIARMRNAALAGAFNKLREHARQSGGARRIQHRIVNRGALAALNGWCAYVARIAGVRSMLSRILGRMEATYLEAWAEYAAEGTLALRLAGVAREGGRKGTLKRESRRFVGLLRVCGTRGARAVKGWNQWQRAMALRKQERLLSKIAYDNLYGSIAGKAFAAMRRGVVEGRKERSADDVWSKLLARKTLRAWQVHHRRQAVKTKASMKAFVHWAKGAAGVALTLWRDWARERRHARFVNTAALVAYADMLRRKALISWADAVVQLREWRVFVDAYDARMLVLRTARVLQQWRSVAADLAELRREVNDFHARSVANRMSESMRQWLLLARTRRVQRSGVTGMIFGRYQAQAFIGWSDVASELKRERRTRHLAATYFVGKVSREVLIAWRRKASTARKHERIMLKVSARMRTKALASSFAGWSETATLLIKQREAAHRVLSRVTNRTLGMAWRRWRENVAELAHMRTCLMIWRRAAQVLPVVRRLRARVLNRVAHACLVGWAGHAAHKVHLREAGQRLQASLGLDTMGRLYALWRTLYRARCYMGEYNATRSFHAWRREAYAASARRMRHNAILAEMLMGTTRRVFIGWFALMIELREARALFQEKQRRLKAAVRYGDLMARRRRFQTMLLQFRAWQQITKALRLFAVLADDHAIRAMRGWRKEARGLALDREFQEVARRHDARRAGRVVLREWLDACGKMDPAQEARLKYALSEMSANRLFSVLAQWSGYVTLCRKRRKALKNAFAVVMEADEDNLGRKCLVAWQRTAALSTLSFEEEDAPANDYMSPMLDRHTRAMYGDRAGAFWRERRLADALQAWSSYTSAMNIDASEAVSMAISRHNAEARSGASGRSSYSLHSRFDTPVGAGADSSRSKLRLRDMSMSVGSERFYRYG